ncbi:MAG: D-glycero-beta-D-manno-heptose 1-phosphate adenylyltransferase, partial [Bacteroidales bacterium]|nr:D-glycero-beta-D-manno-heptose 1-phosphate adenylyltransferase [Bacteroidales bacterium]
MPQLDIIKSKILNTQSLKNQLAIWRFLDKKIVFSNGCFDILHLGHIDYLSKASDFGDILIIGLNTDNSVRKLKGNNRPINDEKSRAMILASLQFVNNVVLFDEDTPYDLIKFVQPDILVKGSDYLEENIVGYDIVKAKGGEVKTIDLVPDISTTRIENKIR